MEHDICPIMGQISCSTECVSSLMKNQLPAPIATAQRAAMREAVIFPLPIWGRFQLTFFIQKGKSPPYFYFRFIWPTDLESVPRWSFPPSLKLIRLSIAELQRCWCGYITWQGLWPWPLTLDSCQTWLVTWSTPPPCLKILYLSVLDLWVMMSAIGHR